MRRRLPIVALLLLAAGWALRLHDLGRQELWFDEAASYFIASMPVPGILRYVTGAVFEHPPLYYVLLHGCIAVLGSTEWALRFPSAFFGLLLVAGTWRATTGLDRQLAPWATALAATSAFLVTYSQEARMYALLQCLGLLATWLLCRTIHKGGPLSYCAYAASMLAGVLTHYFFAFLFVAHACMVLAVSEQRARAWRYIGAGACLLALALAAWVANAAGLRQALLQVWRQSLWGKSPGAIANIARDWAFGGAIISDRPTWQWLPTALMVLLAALGLTYSRTPRKLRLALALWAAVPTICAIVLPYGGLALRHFSYIAPALVMLTAAGLLRLHGPMAIGLGVAAVAAATVPGLSGTYTLDKGQYGHALAAVARQARPTDTLILGNPHQWVLASYYDHTGLERHYAGDGRPLPALRADSGEEQRVWLAGWETWALQDWDDIEAALQEATFEGEAVAYSPDVSLRLLYLTPSIAPTATLGAVSWDEARRVVGISTWAAACRPGDAALVALSWRQAPPMADTAVVLRLVDAEGHVWAQKSGQPLAMPTNGGQQAAGAVASRHALTVPGGTPPGTYALQLGVVDLTTGAQLAATADDGAALGPWLALGNVSVAAAPYPAPDTGQEPLPLASVTYLGSETDVAQVTAGERWTGILQFQRREAARPVALSFALAGAGKEWDLGPQPLAAGALPAEQWHPGETWRCLVEVRLPADLPSGQYRLLLREAEAPPAGLLARLLGRDGIIVDSFSVAARTASTIAGTPSRPLDAVFAGQVRLEGYDIEEGDGELTLRLYWQALAPTAEPQKVFVHLAAAGIGEPLAQDDAYPANVATSDWLPGERFLSEHRLPAQGLAADGHYVLRIGLYSERTMARLPATGTDAIDDHVEIPLELP